MTDIRTLLHDAAPIPSGPLDMDDVRARAAWGLRRRLIAVISGVAAVAALAVPVGDTVFAPASDGRSAVRVGPGPEAVDEATAPDAAAGDGAEPGPGDDVVAAGSGALQGTSSGADPAETSSGPGGEPDRSQEPVASDGYPLASSCSVDNAGLDFGESRTCRFTATAAGGWTFFQPPEHGPTVGDPATVTVRVDSDGLVRIYRSRAVPQEGPGGRFHVDGCGDAVIQPGARVDVTIEQPDGRYDAVVGEWGGGAGEGWGCGSQGR